MAAKTQIMFHLFHDVIVVIKFTTFKFKTINVNMYILIIL